jgi:hypothetical protein
MAFRRRLFLALILLGFVGPALAQVEGDKQDKTFHKALRSTVWIVVQASGVNADGKVSSTPGPARSSTCARNWC